MGMAGSPPVGGSKNVSRLASGIQRTNVASIGWMLGRLKLHELGMFG